MVNGLKIPKLMIDFSVLISKFYSVDHCNQVLRVVLKGISQNLANVARISLPHVSFLAYS